METSKPQRSEIPWQSLFQVDELAAHQYFETFCRQLPLHPETSLMIAVLEDAMVTFKEQLFASDTKHRKMFQEVEEWIWSSEVDGEGEGVFSFVNVCLELAISPAYLRRQILRWKNHAIAEHCERVAKSSHAKKPGRRRYQRSLVGQARQSQPSLG